MRKYPRSSRILFYADLHVGDRSNGRLYTDMIEAEEFITNLAIERKVDWVAFGGDAFKSRNPHDEQKTRWLEVREKRSREFNGAGINEIDLVGNHCRWYKADESGHVFEALQLQGCADNRCHIVAATQETFHTRSGVTFHTLPAQVNYDPTMWTNDDGLDLSICMFHGMVKGCSLNQDGTVKSSEGVPLEILDRPEFDFVLCGDLHIAQILDFKNTRGGYVGSTLQLDATDAGEERGCMIITFLKGATSPQVEFVSVPHAKLMYLTWDTKEPLPDLEPYHGQLLTLKIINANALSSIDLDRNLSAVRQTVRHLTTLMEAVDLGLNRPGMARAVSHAGPVEDFGAYLGQMANLPPDRKERVLNLLREIHGQTT